MKKFILAFLGTLAGIWFSIFIAIFGLIAIVAAAGVASLGKSKAVELTRHSYLDLTLMGEITDRPGRLDPMSMIRGEDNRTQGLNEIVMAIDAVASDNDIDGIVIDCRGSELGLAGRQAIVEALHRFKEHAPEKWIYAYGDMYTQGDYYIATASDSIFINPIGQVFVQGLSVTGLYFKNLLDKIGVDMQVVKVGTYKSAVEPYILTGPSDPAREQQQLFISNMWNSVAGSIAEARKVPIDTVNAWADGATYAMPTDDYVGMRMVDRLMYRHEFEDKIASLTDKKSMKKLSPITPSEYCALRDVDKKGDGKGATIGVLYACGDITDETGEGIVATKLVPEILEMAEDDEIDGLVMYVNSGGGSAFASEQIWEALRQWKEITGKPFYVYMSDYAASGGYYISCGADRIYAQPTTLTGSIGIFGLIPDISGLLNDKVGVNTSTVSTNKGGGMPGILKPMTPAQKAAMQGYVNRGYELFTSRCAQGRKMSQDSIKMIAEGRVWDGSEAIKLGLVDEIGGLDAAIAGMAKRLNVSSWTIRNYPEVKDKWYDILFDAGMDIKSAFVRDELGEMTSLYDALSFVKGMSPIQARMEFAKVSL